MKAIILLFSFLFNVHLVFSQEFCDPLLPQCHVCDAETDEDLEVIGYENSSYLVDQFFVKVNSTLLPNINPATADFGNVQVNNLSDSYGLKSIERMGDSDFYLLTFNNIKNLQCAVDGYEGLIDNVSNSAYIEFSFLNSILDSENSNLSSDTGSIDFSNLMKNIVSKTNISNTIPTNFFITPASKNFDLQWHLKNDLLPKNHIDARRAWSITKGSNDINVYFIDQEFSFNNNETNRIYENVYFPGYAYEGKATYNYYIESKYYGHGEGMLGVYGYNGENSNNIITGIDWNSKIKLIDIKKTTAAYDSFLNTFIGNVYGFTKLTLLKAFLYLYNTPSNNKIHVVNFSQSYDEIGYSKILFNYILDKTISNHPETLFVASAGNFKENLDVLKSRFISGSDFSKPEIMVVGGSSPYDNYWDSGSASSYGSAYGSHVDIVSPAQDIVTPIFNLKTKTLDISPRIGTSQSAAIVSGIASLIYSLQDSTQKEFSSREVKDMIITSAEKYMFNSKKINSGQKIVSFPQQRDEKMANGRVNAHQAVLLAAAHLNHYKEDNKYILKSTDNTDAKSFTIPYDKVLFDTDGANRKYALMLNRHKFSAYKLPSDLLGANGEKVHSNGGLIWESDVLDLGIIDFDKFYAKELKLSNDKLHLYTLDDQISWSARIPIIDYLDLGNKNEARQCKIVPDGSFHSKEVCTTKSERDEHNNLGLDDGHFVSQKLALDQTTGDLIVVRIYKNRAGEELTTTSWNSSAGIISDQDLVHRHLLQNATVGCITEIQGNFITNGTQLKQNECMYSSDRNYRTILLGNQLVTQKKIIDDDGAGIGEMLYEDVSSYNLN